MKKKLLLTALLVLAACAWVYATREPARPAADVLPQNLEARIGFVTEDDRGAWVVSFSEQVVDDQELLFKALGPDERPFRTSSAIPLKVFWRNRRELRIEPGISPPQLEDALAEAPALWSWNQNLKPGRRLTRVSAVSTDRHFDPSHSHLFRALDSRLSGGELLTEITLPPFVVSITNSGTDEAGLTFVFTRPMAGGDLVGRPLEKADLPFTLTPDLPDMKGRWRNSRTLVFSTPMTRADFGEKVVDRPFSLAWKPDFKNLHGQAAPDLSSQAFWADFPGPARADSFYFSRFKILGLNQTGFDMDGRAEFELAFNKPVSLDEVRTRLKAAVWAADPSARDLPVEDLRVGGPASENGATVSFRLAGALGERIAVRVPGLSSADGRGVLKSSLYHLEHLVDNFFTIRGTSLNIGDKYPWKPYFSVQLKEEAKLEELEKYIRLEPPLDFIAAPGGDGGRTIQIFADFTAGPTRLTLLKGLPSRQGVLLEDVRYEVRLPDDLEAKLMFTGRGRYLSPEKPLLVKLAGRGADAVRLQGWRINAESLPTLINVQDYGSSVRARLAMQFSKNLINRVTAVQAGGGEVFERLIDLGPILGEAPQGAYLLKISPLKKAPEDETGDGEDGSGYESGEYYSYSDYYRHTERYLPVMISDLGLAAHALPGKVALWVNSLSLARPVANGEVAFYDEANQVVARGRTGRDGLFVADIDASRAVFATVEKDGDLNYLLLGDRRSSYAGEDYEYGRDPREDDEGKWYGGNSGYLNVSAPDSPGARRDYLARGYEAFLFMPRDLFKPGETVRVKALVRDKDLLPPEKSFPVLWRLNDPDGRTVSQGRAELNAFGGADFTAEIPFSARTGGWSAEIYLPEAEEKLGRADFTVEDFVPPRLAIELAAERDVYQGENPEMLVRADVRYLFGAPGAELNWEMDAVIAPASFRPPGWEGFDFSGPTSDFKTTSQRRAARGRLDEQGRAEIIYRPNLESGRLPAKMAVDFVVSAQEDGGRWNAKRLSVDYFPRELILGYRAPEAPAVKKPFSFELAAVNPAGRPAEIPRLDVAVSRVLVHYYNNYRNGRLYRQPAEELQRLTETRAELAGGRASLDFTPETAGEYQIDIADPVSGLTVSRRVMVHGLETAETDPPQPQGQVELTFDRAAYRPGDTATVKVKSPFPGRLWLTVETTALLHSAILDMPSAETEISLPVHESIKTNAVVTATVIRPLAEGQTGYRALGVKSLEIDREIYKLKVGLDLPKRLTPAAKSTLKIKMTDSLGRPAAGEATVALVDEGVLSLSGFKTPNPWRVFTAGRRMLTRFYDLYEQLLPLEKTTSPFLIPGGGDGLGRSGLFSPFKRRQEILSLFLASVVVDENGEAAVELEVPEFSGQGRLMVVAGSRDRFGSASRRVTISRDLTSEATLPLALAPGDRFEIPIRVFAAAEAPAAAGRGAALRLRTEGPLRLEETEAEFNLEPGQGETRVFRAVAEPPEAGGDQAGIGRLILESRNGLGESFAQTVETAVRPPYPRVTASVSAQTRAAETAIAIPNQGYLKGTLEASLTLAKSPAIEMARAAEFLRTYPYGCLEQTVSRAWLFVAADDLLAGRPPAESPGESAFYGLNAAVKRLATMETRDGGFAYWPGGDEVYEWGSVYAAHFLTEAGQKIELPHGLLDRSLKWLRARLGSGYGQSSGDAGYILAVRAYALYVLALNGEYRPAWVNALKDRYDGLGPSARIFLAGAEALERGNSKPLEILETRGLDLSPDTLGRRTSSLESSPRNLALQLLAWVAVDPLSETARRLAWRVAEDGRANLWRNTQENGLAALALGGYLRHSGEGRPYQATLAGADGRALFTAGPNEVAVAGPRALAPVQDRPLTLTVTGEGRPYYTLTTGGVPLAAPAPKALGLELARTWILEDGRRRPLNTPEDAREALNVARGDRVIVEIEVKAQRPLQNLVLVDLLPGGFEIENPRLAPGAENRAEEAEDEEPPSTRLELREDRLVVIDPWVSPGASTYRYTLRAVTPGEYVLPPTTAEGMYEPAVQAILATGQVRVGQDAD